MRSCSFRHAHEEVLVKTCQSGGADEKPAHDKVLTTRFVRRTHTHTQTHTHAHIHTHTHSRRHTPTNTNTNTNTVTPTRTHTDTHPCKHSKTNTQSHAQTHTQTFSGEPRFCVCLLQSLSEKHVCSRRGASEDTLVKRCS